MTTKSLQDKFYELADKYNSFTEPLENWETLDLADLEIMVNAELQERERASRCQCQACRDGAYFNV